MKKIIKNLCILSVLLLVFSTTIGAVETPKDTSATVVSIIDENGKKTDYTIAEGETVTVPIYMRKEGDKSRSLSQVASAGFFRSGSTVSFVFIPTPAYQYKTLGFTGVFTWTDNNGQIKGDKKFYAVTSGYINASNPGHAILDGSYSVVGFAPIDVFKTYSWIK